MQTEIEGLKDRIKQKNRYVRITSQGERSFPLGLLFRFPVKTRHPLRKVELFKNIEKAVLVIIVNWLDQLW